MNNIISRGLNMYRVYPHMWVGSHKEWESKVKKMMQKCVSDKEMWKVEGYCPCYDYIEYRRNGYVYIGQIDGWGNTNFRWYTHEVIADGGTQQKKRSTPQ